MVRSRPKDTPRPGKEPELWMRMRGPTASDFRWMVWTGIGSDRWFEDENEAKEAWQASYEQWRALVKA